MAEPVIQTQNLTRRYGRLAAVQDLALTVPRGSVYGFLGPNGAGKTTTIRLLLGLIRPTQGNVSLFGEPVYRRAGGLPRLNLLRRIGALVEEPAVYPHLSGRENLELNRRMLGAPRARIEAVLETMRLKEAAPRQAGTYSTGMRQRLALALALLGEPELLVLDEPTNGLDPAGIQEMRELISALPHTHGVTVFLSSHLLNEVEQVATHIGILNEGRLIFQGKPDGLRARLQENLDLGVDRPDEAEQALLRLGWRPRRNGNGCLHVPVNGVADVALINTQLVAAGLRVHHLQVCAPSLEALFLELTNPHSGGG